MASVAAPPVPADALTARVEKLETERTRVPAHALMLCFFLDVVVAIAVGVTNSTAASGLSSELPPPATTPAGEALPLGSDGGRATRRDTASDGGERSEEASEALEAQTMARARLRATIDSFLALRAKTKTTSPLFRIAFVRRVFEGLDAMLKDLDHVVTLAGLRTMDGAAGYQAWHSRLAMARDTEEAKLAMTFKQSTMPFARSTKDAHEAMEALTLMKFEIDYYPPPHNSTKHVALMKAVFFSTVRSWNGRVTRTPHWHTPPYMLVSKSKRHLRSYATRFGRTMTRSRAAMAMTRSSLADRQVDTVRSLDHRAHVTRPVAQPDALDIPTVHDSVRRFTRGMLELSEVDFCGVIRRAWMGKDLPASSKRTEVVVATSVMCPAGAMGRFEAELKRMANIRHPSLLTWLGVLECEHRAFGWDGQLVEVVWECGFRDNLTRFALTATTRKQVFAVLRDVALGLMELHCAGIPHGNVCGENIVITSEGRGRLADFQLLRCLEPVHPPKPDRLTAGELILERYKTGDLTCRSLAGDVYSIAMTAVVALTGELPFLLLSEEEIIETLESTKGVYVHPRPAGIEDGVWEQLSPMLSGDAAERPDMTRVHEVFAALAA